MLQAVNRQDPKKADPSPLRHFHYLLVAFYWTPGSFWSAWMIDGGTSSRISPETVGLLRPTGHWDAVYTWKRETVGTWSLSAGWQSLPRVQRDTRKCQNMLIYSWWSSRTESNEAWLFATLTALEKLLITTCFVSNSRPSLTEDYHRPPGKKILTWQRPVVSAGGQKAQNHDWYQRPQASIQSEGPMRWPQLVVDIGQGQTAENQLQIEQVPLESLVSRDLSIGSLLGPAEDLLQHGPQHVLHLHHSVPSPVPARNRTNCATAFTMQAVLQAAGLLSSCKTIASLRADK